MTVKRKPLKTPQFYRMTTVTKVRALVVVTSKR